MPHVVFQCSYQVLQIFGQVQPIRVVCELCQSLSAITPVSSCAGSPLAIVLDRHCSSLSLAPRATDYALRAYARLLLLCFVRVLRQLHQYLVALQGLIEASVPGFPFFP